MGRCAYIIEELAVQTVLLQLPGACLPHVSPCHRRAVHHVETHCIQGLARNKLLLSGCSIAKTGALPIPASPAGRGQAQEP
jgi:hypothetical protein